MTQKIGDREMALRAQREERAKMKPKPTTPKAAPPATTEAPATPGPTPKESANMRTPKKAAAAKKRPAKKAAPKSAAKKDRSPMAVGLFICRPGGCSMDDLVKAFGVEAHPMRAKIHAAKHKLGFAIDYDHAAQRYSGKAPTVAA